MSDFCPVYTQKAPPYPPSKFFHPPETLQIICNSFEINVCGKDFGQ
jgi:hypothetical protein